MENMTCTQKCIQQQCSNNNTLVLRVALSAIMKGKDQHQD